MTTKPKLTAATEPAAALTAKAPSKSAQVLKLLARTRGATVVELEAPTGWQPHSVRAYLSGLRKQGRTIVREQRKTGETAYRIVEGASPATIAASESTPDNDATAVAAEPDAAAATNSATV